MSRFAIYYNGTRLDEITADDEDHAYRIGRLTFKVPVVAVPATSPADKHQAAAKLSRFGALPLERSV